ncbi:hypothetical protein [Maribacter sp. 2304DJ31-5]|uniref:hypothetical protein n=1 Tax=Maribacter sp. 2304DJ31-5 TaxID=3386273 RepID=UPI0039BD0719
MAFYKLNKKYLPTFIYLMDCIQEKDIEVDYGEVADFETKKKDKAHKISIDRAFKLRTALKEGWDKKPGLPLKPTLNILAAYYEENDDFSFLKFHFKYEGEIQEYFKEKAPDNILTDKLFPKRAQKIHHLETQLETTEFYANEVEAKGMAEFVKNLEIRFNNFRGEVENELKLKTDFILHLKDRIDELESTLAQADFMNNKLGAIGLFFVSIDYGLVTKESLIEGFMDDFDGVGDDFLDDLV